MSSSTSHQISRRDFIKVTAAAISGIIGTVIAIPSIAYLLSPILQAGEDTDVIALGSLAKYPLGIPTRFAFTRTKVNGWERTGITYAVYVLRKSESEVRVFSDICTHLGCKVTWHPDQGHYISPCHDGHFDKVGSVVSGPPPRPLDEYNTKIEAGHLFIHLPPIKREAS